MALRTRVPRIATVSDQTIVCNFLASTETFFNATISTEAFISPNLIPSGETFFNATVVSEAFINPNLLPSTETFYLATVTGGAANILCDIIPSQETFFPAVVAQDDKTILVNLLGSTLTFPLATLTGGITDTDFSDILDKKLAKARKKRKQDQLDEENVAAQILKSRQQGLEEPQKERRKPFDIKVSQSSSDLKLPPSETQQLAVNDQKEDVVFNSEEVSQILAEQAARLKKDLKNRQLQALVMFALDLENE